MVSYCFVNLNVLVVYLLFSQMLQLIILLLLRHSLTITNADGDDDDASTYFSVSKNSETIIFLGYILFEVSITYNLLFSAFSFTGCWIFASMLHHGLGHKYLATSKAKTGQQPLKTIKCRHMFEH